MTREDIRSAKSRSLKIVSDILTTEDGRLARLDTVHHVATPLDAELSESGEITWKWKRAGEITWKWDRASDHVQVITSGNEQPKPRKLKPLLWRDFAALDQAPDEAIRKFAARWGPLQAGATESEKLSDWRQYAKVAHALVALAADVANGDAGLEDNWRTLSEWTHYVTPSSNLMRLNLIAATVNRWYSQCTLLSLVEVGEGRIQIKPSSHRLLGGLIAQIAHVVSRADELTICAGCKSAFKMPRKPSRGVNRYCRKCGKRASWRDAARRFRQRKRNEEV